MQPIIPFWRWTLPILLLIGSVAQAQDPVFRHLSVDDGLSATKVNALVQDTRGFIWAGTVDGLNRFDGYEVREFRNEEADSTSLSDNVVLFLHEDLNGYLWVGTSDGGLNRFDPATETFTRFTHDPDVSNSLANDEVLAIAEDASGHIWIGTGDGLSRFDPNEGVFTTYKNNPEDERSLSHNVAQTLFVDEDGTLWIGTLDGLNRYNPNTDSFTVFRDPENPVVNGVSVIEGSESGEFWIGTFGAGLYLFDPQTGLFEASPVEGEFGASIIVSLYEDNDGTLWIGTGGDGLYERSAGGEQTAYKFDSANPDGLSDNFVRFVLRDRQGIVWAATYNGLDWLDPSRNSFTRYRHIPNQPESLSSNTVHAVFRSTAGALWAGTDAGLDFSSDGSSTFRHFPSPTNTAFVTDIYESDGGNVWVGTQQGLWTLNRQTGRFQHVPLADASIVISSLVPDGSGNLLVGMLDSGFGVLNMSSREFKSFRHEESRSESLGHNQVKDVVVDRNGVVWIGTRGGLDRLDDDTDGGSFSHFTHQPRNPSSLSDNAVLSLFVDQDGVLWVGTEGGGLNRFDPFEEDAGFEAYTESNSDLPSNTVHAIVQDNSDFLWLSTSRGLARFDPVTEAFRIFDDEQGPGTRSLNDAAFKAPDGTLYFGGAEGLIAFQPGQASAANPNPPQIALTDVSLFNESLEVSENGRLRHSAPVAETIYLNYDDYVVTFEFAALHFSDPQRNTYEVMLEGAEQNWRELGTDNRATYTGIDPGRYTLLVRATSADGVVADEPLSVGVVVSPPWWRSIWAYLIYALIFIGAVVLGDRFQRKRLLRQERERAERREAELRAEMAESESRVLKIENERKAAELEQARELEKAYSALEESHRHIQKTQNQLIQAEKLASLGQLTAGIAHEIKNPLNFVNNFAELSIDLAEELNEELELDRTKTVDQVLPELQEIIDDLKQNATRIHEHGRRADRIVHAMLQHSRGGNSEQVSVDVNALVEEYVNLCFHGMRAKDMDFNVEVHRDLDPNAGEITVFPQEIGRVLINLLGNAFYAVKKREEEEGEMFEARVAVSTLRRENSVVISVADNGPGIPKDVRERIFEPFFTTKPSGEGTGLGLSLSYEIITQGHGGQMHMESQEGEGSTFLISLPS